MDPAVLRLFLFDYVAPMFYLVSPKKLALNSTDPDPKYLSRATPMFIIFILVEAFVDKVRQTRGTESKRKANYSIRDVVSSTSCGILEESLQLLVESWGLKLKVFLYALVYKRCCLLKYNTKKFPLCTWLGALLSVDFCYYWLHRSNHNWHLLWSGHRVHHSGENYNLATALRQSMLQRLTSPIFYLPLALVFNPQVFAAHQQLNTMYQFWQHTSLIGWLGPLEYILQTPSSHRMHHRPPGNCNYGGVLIIWDRMFGTYECENVTGFRDNFGLCELGNTWCPVDLNIAHFRRMANIPGSWLKRITRQRPTRNKWVFKPAEIFKPLPQPEKPDGSEVRIKYTGPQLSRKEEAFVLLAGLLALARFVAMSDHRKPLPKTRALCGAASVVATLSALGQYMSTGKGSNRDLAGIAALSTLLTASF